MSTQVFNILRSKPFRWLLVLFGATEARSKVRLHPDSLDVHFGPFHERIALSNLASAERIALKWWQYSLGWRTNLNGGVGLIGDARNLVRLRLHTPFTARLVPGVQVTCRDLYLSLEEPAAFLAALPSRPPAA